MGVFFCHIQVEKEREKLCVCGRERNKVKETAQIDISRVSDRMTEEREIT